MFVIEVRFDKHPTFFIGPIGIDIVPLVEKARKFSSPADAECWLDGHIRYAREMTHVVPLASVQAKGG